MPLSKEPMAREMDRAIHAFEEWRSSRKKKCRIPEHLWEIAASLSSQYPINTICENLGLNWGVLKKKIDQLSLSLSTLSVNSNSNLNYPIKSPPPQKQPSFAELKLNMNNQEQLPQLPQLPQVPQEQASSLLINHSPSPICLRHSRCALEITKRDGTVMKIFASNNAPLNLLEFFKTFLGNSGNE